MASNKRRRNPAPRLTAPRPALPPLVPPFAQAAHPLSGRLLLALPAAVMLLGALLLGLGVVITGAVLVLVGVALLAYGAISGAPTRLVAALGAHPAGAAEARYQNIVEGLCVAHGIATPALLVLEDPAPNAIVLGSSEQRAYLVVTRGALELLDRLELEGLVAHELAHLKRGDTRASSFAIRLLGPFAALGRSGRLLRRVGDPTREFGADQLGASMTRYPPGLRQALEKLERAPSTRPAALDERLVRLTAPFWCAPLDEERDAIAAAGVLDLELRAAALAEL